MDTMQMTEMATLAGRFVNSTNKHIFLTGKAGTGKTTFLRHLTGSTHKQHIVVAPTGIAALNANGVTIHSQFLLPFGTFLPDRNLPDQLPDGTNFYTQQTLIRRHPLDAKRRDVLRNLDLIIIDEVSMLRADVLDAMDARMRHVKRNYREPFGGTQLLMIGDMYQLPPIVKDHEWDKMRAYYRSQHFFEALSLKEKGFVYVELDKIFRQQDNTFISVLNNLRNNTVTETDITLLNKRFKDDAAIPEDVITITTHNYKADALNRQALDRLESKAFYFEASVEGDFPEHMFPVGESLELREGARIMFVKNDPEGNAYYNGKLATVSSILEDGIAVLMDGETEPYTLKHDKWENKKYTVSETAKDLEEEVVGRYFQYPVKLAWAITVHKSQGLTFEKAVIDVGKAFAPGQVYVALSRLTSLEGLTLRTRINPQVVATDEQVVEFGVARKQQEPLTHILEKEQQHYLENLLSVTFNFKDVTRAIGRILQKHETVGQFEDAEMRSALSSISEKVGSEGENTRKFAQQLRFCLQQNDHARLLERIGKGSAYYIDLVKDCLRILLKHIEEVKQFTRTKTYLNALTEVDLILMKKWEQMDKAHQIAGCLLEGNEITVSPECDTDRKLQRTKLVSAAETAVSKNPKLVKTRSGRTRRKKGTKKENGETYKLTYQLAKEGLSIVEIAEKRGLVASTIEGHIAKGIREKEVSIDGFMDEDDRETIEQVLKENKGAGSGEIYAKLNGQYSYSRIRMVQAHLNSK